MKCEDCNYHLLLNGTHFCVSRNHKRTDKRISREDAERDIDCKWADERKGESEVMND